jgi:hypothetical protein
MRLGFEMLPTRPPSANLVWLSLVILSSKWYVPSLTVLEKVPSAMTPQCLSRAILPMRSAMAISMCSFTIYANGWNCIYLQNVSMSLYKGFRDIHKRISQTHHGDDKDIHTQGKSNDKHVEVRQSPVLRKTMYNKVHAHDVYEVEIQAAIDDEVYDFFASVPPFVDVNVSL